MIGSYFCSWSSRWAYSKEELDIKDVESDLIYISFAKPDCSYVKGSFEGTGLSFSSDFQVVAGAIDLLPDTKTVMLSVGGGTYGNWDQLNVDAIVALADDLHCKGIDIDWEPTDGAQSSDKMSEIIEEFRSKYTGFLSFATAHVGAYGHGAYTNSQPASAYTGVNYPGLIKSGDKLDWINVMAYDAGFTFDPLEAFDAYKSIFSKKIYMGIEFGNQAWGGVITSLDDVEKLYTHIKDKGGDLFVWSWLKEGPFTYQEMVQRISTISTKRPIEQVDTPEVQPDKPKDSTPELPIPEQIFEPKLPTIDQDNNKIMWTVGKKLSAQNLVFYNNATYKVLATHTANEGWEPTKALSLFTLVKDPLKTDWIPQMEYFPGETVLHQGKQYTCVIGHTSQTDWAPGKCGLWK
jgi:hypothetical protein